MTNGVNLQPERLSPANIDTRVSRELEFALNRGDRGTIPIRVRASDDLSNLGVPRTPYSLGDQLSPTFERAGVDESLESSGSELSLALLERIWGRVQNSIESREFPLYSQVPAIVLTELGVRAADMLRVAGDGGRPLHEVLTDRIQDLYASHYSPAKDLKIPYVALGCNPFVDTTTEQADLIRQLYQGQLPRTIVTDVINREGWFNLQFWIPANSDFGPVTRLEKLMRVVWGPKVVAGESTFFADGIDGSLAVSTICCAGAAPNESPFTSYLSNRTALEYADHPSRRRPCGYPRLLANLIKTPFVLADIAFGILQASVGIDDAKRVEFPCPWAYR